MSSSSVPVEVAEPSEGVAPAAGPLEVELDGIGFSYRTGPPVLRDVSFTIPAESVVAVVGAIAGLRAWALREDAPVLRRLGLAVIVVLAAQLLLGLAALIPIMARRADWRTVGVVLATAHQANGAILLALSVQLVAWTRRLPGAAVTSGPETAAQLGATRSTTPA